MENLAYVAPTQGRAVAQATTIISTNSRGHQTDFAPMVLVMLPDGSIGTRQEALNYDRQQISTHYQHE